MKKSFLISFIYLIFNFNSNASIYSKCDTCVSTSDFKAVAEFLSEQEGARTNTVFVENNGNVKKFVVRISKEPGFYMVDTFERDLTASEATTVSRIKRSNENIAGFLSNNREVPESIARSAYDMVGASYIQNDIIDHYVNNQSFRQYVANYTGAVAALVGKIVNVTFTIDLTFSNDSTAVFTFTGIDGNGKLTFSLKSARDVDNNNIPLTKSGYVVGAPLNFTKQGPNGAQEYLYAASRLGISISSGTGGSGGGLQTRCIEAGSDKLICYLVKP